MTRPFIALLRCRPFQSMQVKYCHCTTAWLPKPTMKQTVVAAIRWRIGVLIRSTKDRIIPTQSHTWIFCVTEELELTVMSLSLLEKTNTCFAKILRFLFVPSIAISASCKLRFSHLYLLFLTKWGRMCFT